MDWKEIQTGPFKKYGSADLIRALMFVNLQSQTGNGSRLLE